jgi:hypothetical protein
MSNGPYIVDETCLVFVKNIETENEELRAENERLRNALTAILNDVGYHNPTRMTTEISDKILEDAVGALHDHI